MGNSKLAMHAHNESYLFNGQISVLLELKIRIQTNFCDSAKPQVIGKLLN